MRAELENFGEEYGLEDVTHVVTECDCGSVDEINLIAKDDWREFHSSEVWKEISDDFIEDGDVAMNPVSLDSTYRFISRSPNQTSTSSSPNPISESEQTRQISESSKYSRSERYQLNSEEIGYCPTVESLNSHFHSERDLAMRDTTTSYISYDLDGGEAHQAQEDGYP